MGICRCRRPVTRSMVRKNCRSVAFSPPRMYFSPGRPVSIAKIIPPTTSSTSDPVADVPAEVQQEGNQAAVVHVDQSRDRVPFGQIAGAIDPRGVDDDHGDALFGGFNGQPLAFELASLVVGQTTVGRPRRGFVGQLTRRRRSGGELRGGPDDPPDPGPPSGVEDGQHRPHVQLVIDLAAWRPVLRVAGQVIDFGAAIDGAGDGVAIGQIAGDRVRRVGDPAGRGLLRPVPAAGPAAPDAPSPEPSARGPSMPQRAAFR